MQKEEFKGKSDKLPSKKIRKANLTQLEFVSSDDDDEKCLYCGYFWSETNEAFIHKLVNF